MFEQFNIDDRKVFKVCVIATMSSGKSTFINSIIGEEIMPEKNEACTARTMAVLDNDSKKNKLAHIIRKNGDKEIIEISSRDVLDRVNNDEDVADFVVETNIISIHNTSRALMLVDTPGVNNSEDARHGQRTEEFLKQLDNGVIIYLMNATQLATTDDSVLLQLVSEHIKSQNGNVKIFFVINKIDALDVETESISNTVSIAKEYIESHGIKNPIIYPMSALAAKSLRMALYHQEMTKRELRNLENIYENYQPKDNNMMLFAMADDLSEEKYKIGKYTVSAQDLQRAIDNTGITAVEKKIESYMRETEQHYSPEIVIKTSLPKSTSEKYQDRLNKLTEIPLNSSEKLFDELISAIEKNRVMSVLNYSLGAAEESTAITDIVPDMTLVNDNFDLLIKNIEKSKEDFFEIFAEKRLIGAKHKKETFFTPTSIEKEQINTKYLFFFSVDGINWNPVNFGQISKLIEERKDFFLFNAYEPFTYKVDAKNANNIIPLLDIKIPIRLTRIAGLYNSIASIEDVYEHIKHLSNEEAAHQKELQEAEDQFKRTYKGIVFNSENEKNEVLKLEEDAETFCKNVTSQPFETIYEYKNKISKYPTAIFSGYVTKLISALDMQEIKEKNAILDQIESARIDEVDSIADEIKKHNYSETTKQILNKNIDLRRMKCQRSLLDKKIVNIPEMNRSELSALKNEILNLNFANALVEEYADIIQRQYDTREIQELRSLCSDIDQYDIPKLYDLEKVLKNEKYQDKYTQQYFEMISSRIEHLHIKNMEATCLHVENADRPTLNAMRTAVENENCKSELKGAFFKRIHQREEAIDYEDLCNLTTGLERKSVHELDALLKELYSGKYSEKYVKRFQLKTRVALERAQYAYLKNLTRGINQMSRNDLQSIADLIKTNNYPKRVSSLINSHIDEQIYVLDMNDLIHHNNVFDTLSLSDINFLRRQIQEKNVCQRSKDTYFKKLDLREMVIGYEKVSPLACFAKQNIDQMGINRFLNIKLATFSQDYLPFLEKHFEMLGRRNYENIPVFIVPECSSFALNKTSFFCNTSTEYCEYKLDDIQSITVDKKMFSYSVKILLSSGNSIHLSDGINKNNSSSFVALLLAVIQNIGNETVLSQYQPYRDQIYPINEDDFEVKTLAHDVNLQTITDLFLNQLNELSCSIKMPSVKYAGNSNWEITENKVLTGFGITSERHLLMYYDKTFFNTAKEGVAFGEHYVHIKVDNQSLISIPNIDIVDVEHSTNCLRFHTVKNGIFTSEFTALNSEDGKKVARCINEYIKGTQFIDYNISKTDFDTNQVNGKLDSNPKCPACNAPLKIGAKFCAQCGKKIEEFCFCTNCGKLIPKGKKFCSNCGNKIY